MFKFGKSQDVTADEAAAAYQESAAHYQQLVDEQCESSAQTSVRCYQVWTLRI